MEEKEIINEDQEIKEEVPATEEVVNEPKEEPVEEDTAILINKPDPEGKPYGEVVEEERTKVIAQNKKSQRLSTISIIAVLACSVTGLFLLSISPIVAYILMGVSLVVLIVFSIVIHRVAKPDVQGYIVKASTAINEFTFADNRFAHVKYDPSDKLQLEDVSSDGAFSDLVRVASRNLVEGDYEGRSFKVCEAAFFKTPQGKKQIPVFIGKYLGCHHQPLRATLLILPLIVLGSSSRNSTILGYL